MYIIFFIFTIAMGSDAPKDSRPRRFEPKRHTNMPTPPIHHKPVLPSIALDFIKFPYHCFPDRSECNTYDSVFVNLLTSSHLDKSSIGPITTASVDYIKSVTRFEIIPWHGLNNNSQKGFVCFRSKSGRGAIVFKPVKLCYEQ